MRKVIVIKEFPFFKVGEIRDLDEHSRLQKSTVDDFDLTYAKEEVNQMIQDGWLEEVEEENPLLKKLQEADVDYHGYIRIVMLHAVEVAEKARDQYTYRSGCEQYIIDALKKESELNKPN